MSSMLLVAPSFTLCNLQNPKLPKSLSKTPPPPLSLKPQTTLQTLSHNLIISGPSHLSGHVRISGSKNSALPVLAAALCCSEGGPSILRGIPDLSDVTTMISILQSLGARIDVEDGGVVVVVDAEGIGSVEPCSDSVGRIRAGFFVVGPLVGRLGEAVMALPGGCEIGSRPIDLFVRGLRALSAVVEVRHGKLHVCAANGKGLIGGRFHLDYPSVGATETLMMAASVANGVTVLTNAAQEPEVADLARFLVASGASIEGAGTSTVIISGRKKVAWYRIHHNSRPYRSWYIYGCCGHYSLMHFNVTCYPPPPNMCDEQAFIFWLQNYTKGVSSIGGLSNISRGQ
ncbi:hypothetical protein AAC387_Pa05g0113 [Persea americana]